MGDGASSVFYNAPNDTLYWAEINGNIHAAAPDGSGTTVIYATAGRPDHPRDIEVLGDTIYWVDNAALRSAPADGSGPITTLATANNGNLRALDTYNGRIYLGEFSSNSVNSTDTVSVINADGTGLTVLHQGQFGSLRGLAVGTTPAQLRLCADQNGDGLVNPADFNAWVINFNAGDSKADTNRDGLINPADFNAWVIAFNAGANGPRCFP